MARAPVHIISHSNRYTIKIIEKWGVWEKLYKISHHFNSHHIILYYIIKCYPKKKIFFHWILINFNGSTYTRTNYTVRSYIIYSTDSYTLYKVNLNGSVWPHVYYITMYLRKKEKLNSIQHYIYKPGYINLCACFYAYYKTIHFVWMYLYSSFIIFIIIIVGIE